MALTLDTIAEGTMDYPATIDANFAAIASFVNSLAAQISAAVGDGAQLILDAFDRPGIVGSASYQLDLEAYDGTALITVGRRPVYDAAKGDQDVSVAFVRYGGDLHRCFMNGDVAVNAGGIVSGLPKTVYMGIPADGTPQFYEDTSSTEVLYIYSMTWDGIALSDFQRIANILPGYTFHQDLVGAPVCRQLYDGDTDWLAHDESKSGIQFGGSWDDNEVDLADVRQITHGFVDMSSAGDDGFLASGGPDPIVELELWDETDTRCNLEDILLDASNVPDTVYFKIDPATMLAERFTTHYKRFRLVKVSVGAAVESARGFSWGLFHTPVLGTPIPKGDDVGSI